MNDWIKNIHFSIEPNLVFEKGIRVLAIILISWIVIVLFKLISRKVLTGTTDKNPDLTSEKEKRGKTISNVIYFSGKLLTIIFAIFIILREFGVDLAPLLAGAGVIGIAIGFGAQNIVKDFFSGMFIILEDQMRVGDSIKIGEYEGIVEDISFRITKLRALNGTLHIIPNGNIVSVSNMSHGWSRAHVKFGVSYNADYDKVKTILEDVGMELSNDPEYKQLILESAVVLGIDDFADSAVVISTLTKTKAQKQWIVAREYRRRVKQQFDLVGIEIPFPQVVVNKSN